MVKFEAGKTYYTSSLGDSNCIIKVEIVARTAKTVQARVNGDPHAGVSREAHLGQDGRND
jgi:hypothetical protein